MPVQILPGQDQPARSTGGTNKPSQQTYPAQIRSNISVLAPRRRQPQRRRQAPAGLILACLRVIDRVAWRCAWWWCLGAANGGVQFASLNGAAQLCALQWDGRGEASGKSGGPGRTSKPYMPLSTPKAEAVCRFNNLHTQKESEVRRGRDESFSCCLLAANTGEGEATAHQRRWRPNNNCHYWFLA